MDPHIPIRWATTRWYLCTALLATLLLGSPVPAASVPPPIPNNTAYDGSWSVSIVTEQGPCDPNYHFYLTVENGVIRSGGNNGAHVYGMVTMTGQVYVGIRYSDAGANAVGRLSANAGVGTWRGAGSKDTCAGRWDAAHG